MNQILLTLIILLPVIVIVGALYWLIRRPSVAAKELEARAAAGDPEAKAQLGTMRKTSEAMRRLARGGDDPERQRLLAVGKPGRALVVDVRPLDVRVAPDGHVPVRMVEVKLAIELGEGASREVTVVDTIAEPLMERMAKGSTVPIRIDPLDPEHVVALWDAL